MTYIWCCSPTAKIYGNGNQGVEVGLDTLTIISSDPHREFVLPNSTTYSVKLEVLVPQRLLSGVIARVPLKAVTIIWLFWVPYVNQ